MNLKLSHPLSIVLLLFFLLFPPSLSFSDEPAETHFKKGMELNKSGKFIQSREELIKAVHLSIKTDKYHQALFFNFLQTRSGPQGVAFYKNLANQHPNNPAIHYWLGRLYLQKNSLQEAASEFTRATQLAPKDEHPFIALGHTYWKMENMEEAQKAYEKANQIKPEVAVVNEGLGNVYFYKKEYSKAQKAYEKALQLNPALNESRFNLGLIYEEQSQWLKAANEWKTILESDPNVSEAREKLAQIYFRAEEYEEAAREYSMILKVRPGSPETYMAFGESLILLAASKKDPEEIAQIRNAAIDAFQHVIDFDPGNSKAQKYLETLTSTGNSSK